MMIELHPQASPRHTVAVVEDQVDMRELLVLRLGIVPSLVLVGQASTGADAVNLAREVLPDLMTLDLRMPIMGGAEAIPLLRAVAPGMRIVVYTADIDAAHLSGGSRPDATVFKGANLEELVTVVLGLLAEGPLDAVEVDLDRIPVQEALDAFDGWIGLHAPVRESLATNRPFGPELVGKVRLRSSKLRGQSAPRKLPAS